jgi:hypothetical protein
MSIRPNTDPEIHAKAQAFTRSSDIETIAKAFVDAILVGEGQLADFFNTKPSDGQFFGGIIGELFDKIEIQRRRVEPKKTPWPDHRPWRAARKR